MPNNNSILRDKMLVNPLIVYTITQREPETLFLTPYEYGAFPAIIGNLLSLSVERITPLLQVGRVRSFDVLPRNGVDPVFVYSPIGDLKPYCTIWTKIITRGVSSNGKELREFDNAIKHFISTSYNLETDELIFAIIEMLKFKNDVALNEGMGRVGLLG